MPVMWTLFVSAGSAVAFGIAGHWLAVRGWFDIPPEFADLVPDSEHIAYVTNLWAHTGSYIGGITMGIGVVFGTWKRRGRLGRRRAARPSA